MGAQAVYSFKEPVCISRTIVNVYKMNGNTVGELVSTSSAIIDGMGQVEYFIQPGRLVTMGYRMGIPTNLSVL